MEKYKKKIVATAEVLSSLDLLIADKKEKKADFVHELYWVVHIILFQPTLHLPIPRRIDDYPAYKLVDKFTNSAIHILKEASVGELVQLREAL